MQPPQQGSQSIALNSEMCCYVRITASASTSRFDHPYTCNEPTETVKLVVKTEDDLVNVLV